MSWKRLKWRVHKWWSGSSYTLGGSNGNTVFGLRDIGFREKISDFFTKWGKRSGKWLGKVITAIIIGTGIAVASFLTLKHFK